MGKPATNHAEAPPELIEFIQFYALRGDPLTLTIESASCQRGWIGVDEGDVVRVWTAGGKTGVDAFVEIVSWNQPNVVQLERGEVDEPNVELPLAQLLMETYWKAIDHVPTDPDQEEIPTGLEEDTVAGRVDIGPPDGVTKEVLETAQQLCQIKGFIAVALIASTTGLRIEMLGARSRLDVPEWMGQVVCAQAADDTSEHAVFLTTAFIDVLLPPSGNTEVSYLLRVDRRATNRGQVEVALRSLRT